MKDELSIERAIAGIGLGLVALGCIAILWPFATSLLWATIIVFSTWPLFVRVEAALGGRTVAAAGSMTLLRTALLVAPIGQSSNLLNAGPKHEGNQQYGSFRLGSAYDIFEYTGRHRVASNRASAAASDGSSIGGERLSRRDHGYRDSSPPLALNRATRGSSGQA